MTTLSGQLGVVLKRKGDLQGAEKLYREMLPRMRGTENYVNVAHNLGEVLRERGLVTESRKYLDMAVRRHGRGLGADHPSTLLAQERRNGLDPSLRTCAQCGPIIDKDLVMKVCSVCKAARYCGAGCQKLHWKTHKPECKRIAAENEAIAAGSDGAGPSGDQPKARV